MATNGSLGRKLRMGIVGGGQGSFIGRVHVTAAVLDNRAALVAGALSSDPERSRASAADYDIAADRAYGSYQEMFETERSLGPDEGIDFVSIATPNHMHFPVAKAAIEAGFHVICDKPLTLTLAQAEELSRLVAKSPAVFAVTHNYTGYPLVRQAREMILSGELGDIQAIRAEYIQGWLRTRLENEGQKQAAWRTDPAKSGAAGCFGDIGTHAYNLGRYMTGLLPESISAHLRIFEPPRPLDDYGHAVIRYDYPHSIYTRDPNAPFTNALGRAACRLPSGHPEAFFEAFANVYRAAFDAMVEVAETGRTERTETVYPNIHDGVEGMYFIEQAVASSRADGKWLPLKHPLARH
jgi:predicted dehydrogenase